MWVVRVDRCGVTDEQDPEVVSQFLIPHEDGDVYDDSTLDHEKSDCHLIISSHL